MTEQEIVNILKENKTKGIAFVFMPKEVQDWCSNRHNYFNDFLLYKNGAWRDEYCFVNPSKDLKEMALEEIFILALPDSFQIKKESKGEWVEFEINRDGFFKYLDWSFQWFDWSAFLNFSFEKKFGQNKDFDYFTAFGGWQYEDSKRWYLAPAIKLQDGDLWNSYVIEERGEATPVIPVKIRFWKKLN